MLNDLRFAFRSLTLRPAFTLVVVATLALGIGATTAVFSVVDAVLLRPLPFPDSQDLVMVWERNFPRDRKRNVVASPNFLAWRAAAESFEDLAAFSPMGATLAGDGPPERVRATAVTPGFFALLGVEPALGRRFDPEEGVAGNDAVVVLSHGLWQRRFGGDPEAVGGGLSVNGVEHAVIGVLPQGFALPKVATPFGTVEDGELFLPLALRDEYGGRSLLVLGRLAPGAGLGRAQSEMTALAERLEAEHDYNQGWGANVVGLHEQVVGHLSSALRLLLGAVALVLAIACVNVAGLLLARATARRRELAVRATLGASRGRLAAQLLTESLLVAAAGGTAGLLLASWGIDLLTALAPESLPRAGDIAVDGRALAFTAGTSLLAALAFGLAPALRASRAESRAALAEGERGSAAGGRLRAALVVTEVAVALLLVLGSGLLLKSFARLVEVDPGFDATDVVSVKISLPGSDYAEDARVAAFYRDLLGRLEGLPLFESAAAAMTQPFDGFGIGTSFLVEGRPDPGRRERPVTDVRPVTPGYFRTLDIPLFEGRDFDRGDVDGAPRAAVVSRTLANEFWPGGGALGKEVVLSLGEMTPFVIVGVVDDVKHMGLDTTPRAMVYVPHAQFAVRGMAVLMRSSSETGSLAAAVREAIAEIDPALPIHSVTTLEDLVAASVAEERFQTTLLTVFAAVALALAAVGLYGLLSYSVSRRTHEIGIRLALGAGRSSVLGLVIRQAAVLTSAGLVLGLAGALGLARLLESLLFEVSVTDLATYAVAAAVLLAVGLLAGFLPARRASRVDPIVALRRE